MSLPPPSTPPPSAAETENLSVFFIGFVVETVLYGLTFFQTYIYYSRFPRDHKWIKYLVATLCTLDTVTSALVSEVLYYYLIILFDVNMDVVYATTTFCVQYLISVILTFISRLFFAHRIFQVTGGSRRVTLILVFLSFIALVFGLTVSVQMFVQRRLSEFGSLRMEITAVISHVTGIMADVIVVATMCYSLRGTQHPEMARSGILQVIVTLLVGRGVAFTLAQMFYFSVFVAVPSRQFWVPLQMVATKLYVNTLLGHLNLRDVIHGRGLNEEESLIDRKIPASKRLAGSVRVNVTDGKATIQTVSLNTRQDESTTESERIGSDSSKSYPSQQEVSTGSSSQSQTDNGLDKGSLPVPSN